MAHTNTTLTALRQGVEIQSAEIDDFGSFVAGPHELWGKINGVTIQLATVPLSSSNGMMRPDGKGGSKEYAHADVDENQSISNLERLALCWNCHDDLVAALESITERSVDLGVNGMAQHVAAARAVLAKAKGR